MFTSVTTKKTIFRCGRKSTKETTRPMTEKETAAFDRAMSRMDKAFKEMDRAFDELTKD